jgi:cyclase
MLKKRLIFTLLYDQGNFMLSRNFRLQKVGDLAWLLKNYDFSKTSFAIDELIVLDVSRADRNIEQFSETLKKLSRGCFMPIAAGGGITTLEQARILLRSGADKIVINSLVHEDPVAVQDLANAFGQQCLVCSLDVRRGSGQKFEILISNGTRVSQLNLATAFNKINELPIGELYLNSIDQDGTGQGYDLNLLDQISDSFSIPVIAAGGVGNYHHLAEGLDRKNINAAATAHLFNFMGDGLASARKNLIAKGYNLATFV